MILYPKSPPPPPAPSLTHIFLSTTIFVIFSHTTHLHLTHIFVHHHLCHTHNSLTSHTHLRQPPSLSHTLSFHTQLTYISHTSFSTTIFVTRYLSHTTHTQLCQPSFTHLSHTSHTLHAQLTYILHASLSATIFVTRYLSHTTHTQLCQPSLRGRRGTWSHLPSFCVAGVALMALGGALGNFSRR